MGSGMIVQVGDAEGVHDYAAEESLEFGRKRVAEFVPAKFTTAEVTNPGVAQWVRDIVTGAVSGMRDGYPVVRTGPSLVLAGKPGRGKSWQLWGALRALSLSGVYCRWQAVTATELFASMRPRAGVDTEDVFTGYATAGVLAVDDVGATKDTAWTDEVFDRLINHRYEWVRPTLITTNVLPSEFSEKFGERIASRLTEMARVVPFGGPDLRRGVPSGR